MRGTGERLVNSDGASPVRVLLVEDDPDTAGILELVLKTDGHEVRCAANAFEALLEVRKFQPHVAVVDVGFAIVDGCALAKRIRSRVRCGVIGISGRELPTGDPGADYFDAYFVKPLDFG